MERVPNFPHLKERNVRTGFLTAEGFSRLAPVCEHVGIWLRGMLEVGYTYGWRRDQIRNLRVKQLDFVTKTIRLNPGTTKNGDGREVKMTDSVEAILLRCVGEKTGDDYVFTKRTKPVGDFRKAWDNCCRAAGVEGLLFHDLRRSAARNMRMAGLAEGIIMKVGGWRTHAIFDRYSIINSLDMDLAVRRIEVWQRRIGLTQATAENRPLKMPHAKGTGTLFRRKDSPYWWAQYYFKGRPYQVSTKETEEDKARAFLDARLADIEQRGMFLSGSGF